MKKSFKKAGAAVLSMAMLLSMGAISMPVFAADTPVKPAQVTVKVSGLSTAAPHQGEGQSLDWKNNGDGSDDDAANIWNSKAADDPNMPGTYTEKYDYLTLGGTGVADSVSNIEKAKVTMYRVAELTNNKGWQWVKLIEDQRSSNPIPNFTDFAALLANKDGTDADDDKSGITGDFEFKTPSKDLQEIASYLERVIEKLKTSNPTELAKITVGTDDITSENVTNGVTIPVNDANVLDTNDDGVLSLEEQAKTQNVIGYYLIVTETDQSGVIVQPVLVSLRNGEQETVSVKGSTIKFEKTMTGIVSGTETTTEGEAAEKGSDRFNSTAGNNIKNGLVAMKDIVKYEIVSQLPSYDANVLQKDITDFVIYDTASDGISIDAPADADGKIDASKFKVYLAKSSADLTDENKRWELTGSTKKNVGDYQLEVKKAVGDHGFKLTITGFQMIQEDSRWNEASTTAPTHNAGDKYPDSYAGEKDKKPDQVKYIVSGTDEAEDMSLASMYTSANKTGTESMEKMYISVQFQATVDKDKDSKEVSAANESKTKAEGGYAFDRTYDKYIGIGEVTAAEYTDAYIGETDETDGSKKAAALADDVKKQILRAKLFKGETRYNQTYEASDYSDATFRTLLMAEGKTGLDPTNVENLNDDGKKLKLALGNPVFKALFDEYTNKTEGSANTQVLGDAKTEGEDKVIALDNTDNRIKLLLAKDKHNIELNGEYNTAHMTYGNRYATGGGSVKMTTNYSKVYSVDLALSKFVETLKITGEPEIPATYTGYGTYYDALKSAATPITVTAGGKTVTFTSIEDTKIASPTSGSDEETVLNALDAASLQANTDASDDHKAYFSGTSALNANIQKVLKYLIDAENTTRETNDYYSNSTQADPVETAIFQLVRTSQADGKGDIVEDLGYAISTNTGKLLKLENVVETEFDTKAAAEAYVSDSNNTVTGKTGFVFQDANGNKKWRVGYITVNTDESGNKNYTGDETWKMLDIGYYTVYELSVPTGFKKWDKTSFEIKADKEADSSKYLEDGSFIGSYSAESTIAKDATATTSKGLASIKETQDGGTFYFDYYADETKAHSNGVLSHRMYNEYLDELPATGGMGTVLFTAGGIAVILMAGALFVVYMKKRNAEEEE